MSAAILQWLGGHDTGASSKVLALSALGSMPASASSDYPHDGADFGRCLRLLKAAPEARAGLTKLASDAGPYWTALIIRWGEIEAAYNADLGKPRGEANECYALMRSILDPIREDDPRFVRLGSGASVRFGK